jgi:hypothetical protein
VALLGRVDPAVSPFAVAAHGPTSLLGLREETPMVRLQWDTLRVGDAVNFHSADTRALTIGVVAIVASGENDQPHDVTIRVDDDDDTWYVQPSMGDVHLDPVDTTDTCVHCRLLV